MSKLAISTFICLVVLACSTPEPSNPWADFTQCANKSCLKEAIAVKDALVKSPKPMLLQFQATYEKGEDHVIGWLYFMRDSVLTNPAYGTLEQRTAIQNAIMTAIKPYFDDAKMMDMAANIAEVIAPLDLTKPYVEEEAVEPLSIPLTGTYEYDLPNSGGTGELLVSQISYDSFQFKLSIVGPPPAHNMGFMEGIGVTSAQGHAVYITKEYGDECALDITFVKDSVRIHTLSGTDADCGFGHNVHADGIYKRSSYANPFFTPSEAKAAQKLVGKWVSATDPKSAIKIADGQYIDIYDGKEMGTALYLFCPTCPADCGAASPMPCLKVMAQDDICFAIVKADGKTLELSQIGGTGNTLKYNKQ